MADEGLDNFVVKVNAVEQHVEQTHEVDAELLAVLADLNDLELLLLELLVQLVGPLEQMEHVVVEVLPLRISWQIISLK